MRRLTMLLAGMQEAFDKSERLVWLTCWGAGMTMLIADLIALYWVGMWLRLGPKKPKRAFTDTLGRGLGMDRMVARAAHPAISCDSTRVDPCPASPGLAL